MHQRRGARAQRLLRASCRGSGATSGWRAARGRRLELRCAEDTRSSFHTTICVLEGLLEYERAVGNAPEVASASMRGHEYLLTRRLFRRLSTGEVVDQAFLRPAFPPRYHYDILRALEYFRAAGVLPEARMDESIQVLEDGRQPTGDGSSTRRTTSRWRLRSTSGWGSQPVITPQGAACAPIVRGRGKPVPSLEDPKVNT